MFKDQVVKDLNSLEKMKKKKEKEQNKDKNKKKKEGKKKNRKDYKYIVNKYFKEFSFQRIKVQE